MDRKELFSTAVKQEVKSQRKQAKVAASAALTDIREEAKRTEQHRQHEERREKFESLAARNKNVVDGVRSFSQGLRTWDAKTDDEKYVRKHGDLVVLGTVPKSEIMPDHIAVCLVSYVEHGIKKFRSDEVLDPTDASAQFKFAYVPKNELQAIIASDAGSPLEAMSELGSVVKDENTYEVTLSSYGADDLVNIGHTANYFMYDDDKKHAKADRNVYSEKLTTCTTRVEQCETNLKWVFDAAADVELNPHLQQAMSEPVNLSKGV